MRKRLEQREQVSQSILEIKAGQRRGRSGGVEKGVENARLQGTAGKHEITLQHSTDFVISY